MQLIARIFLGFIAAALAVLVVHQPIIAALAATKVIPAVAYNMEPLKTAPVVLAQVFSGMGFKGWPLLFNNIFWGGLWGVVYSLVALPLLPAGWSAWVKGLAFGAFITVASNWLLLPYLKAQPLFGGFDPARMLVTLSIILPFGIAVALFYRLLGRRN
jgi:hypothetical protein